MKKINLLYFILSVVLLFSCKDDILDIQPRDKILELQVWQDENLLNAYVVNLYSRVRFPYPYNTQHPAQGEIHFAEAICSDEALTPHTWHGTFPRLFGIINPNFGSYMDYWDYNLIRDLNTFLENSSKIDPVVIDENTKKERIAEVRFMRAFTYFELVKRYGGVPLIDKLQSIDDPRESLFVSRNSESEIIDFISKEIDDILDDLPVNIGSQRFTKWAALALKSRVMLFAGSVSKYGQVQLDGLLGISPNKSNEYFQMAYDAAMQLIPVVDGGSNSIFSLYTSDIEVGNLESYATNYYNLFNKSGTSESIFEKQFVANQVGNSLNFWENNLYPTVEFINDYEMVNGSSSKILFDGAVVNEMSELWKNKEPRFHATFRYDQQLWFQGDTIFTHNYVKTLSGNIDNNPGTVYTKANGKWIRGSGNYASSTTPFPRKKMAMPVRENAFNQSENPGIIFRLGEIYLNAAEAAYEVGKISHSLALVNRIRERAGIDIHTEIDMSKIRHERKIELAYEGHRFWDLKRWRVAHLTREEGGLNGMPKRIEIYFDLRDNMYHFINSNNAYPNPVVFRPHYYYMPLRISRTANNPMLLENPEY